MSTRLAPAHPPEAAGGSAPGGTLVEVSRLTKIYKVRPRLLSKPRPLTAVNDVSFAIEPGGTFGLVGESGSGKTTIARIIMGAETATTGSLRIADHHFGARHDDAGDAWRHRFLQPVLQDPHGALDPAMRIGRIIDEPLRVQRPLPDEKAYRARVADLLGQVGLPPAFADRLPGALSGGQRQRVAIARALALDPKLLVLDEPVSALDVSIQAQVLNLLKDLQDRHGLTYLLISHDLAVVAFMATRIGVLYLGQFMELGGRRSVLERPAHPYTQALIAAAEPALDQAVPVSGEIPSPLDPPLGCSFHPRCHKAQARCRVEKPLLRPVGPDHWAACHFAET
ncbi:oligopeptide/dipeptide ABC transporter ATP-binding protein [Xanthobacter autotrophicus DSM 431]|uniref:ABC transporter ATP-binding protein n=1 Tax=Xanthobacter nonsaccharivorans TaxID=3119912 RepID=UPI00372B2EC9